MQSDAKPIDTRTRVHGLDALRGLAATGVVVTHAVFIHPLGVEFNRWYADYFSMGVPLFFIVSAMSMSLAYSDGIGLRNAFSYALRRFLRIAPLFYLLLAAWLHVGIERDAAAFWQNITFTFGFFSENQISLVPAGWSIGVEVIFYLLFPILAIFRSIWAAVAMTVIAFGAAYFVNYTVAVPQPDYFFWTHFGTNAPYFALGFLAYEIYRRVPEKQYQNAGLFCLTGGLTTLVLSFLYGPTLSAELVSIEPVPLSLIAGWGTGFALLALSQALFPVRALVNRGSTYLGKISYSVYLLHPLIIWVSFITPWAAAYAPDGNWVVPFVSAATLALVLPIAAISFHVFENPFIRLARNLTRKKRAAPQRDKWVEKPGSSN
ncbi:acyltransferase [Tateyamaria omphalii]|nr:acyltransferase [Tateyamaria omphalii]